MSPDRFAFALLLSLFLSWHEETSLHTNRVASQDNLSMCSSVGRKLYNSDHKKRLPLASSHPSVLMGSARSAASRHA